MVADQKMDSGRLAFDDVADSVGRQRQSLFYCRPLIAFLGT